MGYKKDGAELTEDFRSAGADIMADIVGGETQGRQPTGPADPGPSFEEDRGKLIEATGKDHFVAEKDVSGNLLGKVELGGDFWGRVSQENGSVALIPWQDDMEQSLGKEVSISREQGQTICKQMESGIERDR